MIERKKNKEKLENATAEKREFNFCLDTSVITALHRTKLFSKHI